MITDLFIQSCVQTFKDNTERIEKCLSALEASHIWHRPNQSSNSIGNQLLHLCGNIHQYVISGLGGLQDIRERDKEFATSGGWTKEELLKKLKTTVKEAIQVMENLDSEQLAVEQTIQGFNHTGVSNLVHVTEHYSYHLGQIAFWTKQLIDKDLGFYSDFDLNQKNQIG